MKLVLNEVTEAERIIADNELSSKPSETLSLLARYYRQIRGMKPKEITARLYAFLGGKYNDFHEGDWEELVGKLVRKSDRYPLLQINGIEVTQTELDAIRSIKNKRLEKLAFTLLVLAKYGNVRNEKNNDWVLTDKYRVFKRARITGDLTAKFSALGELKRLGLLNFSKCVTNINVQVTFIDSSSEAVLTVTDMRELGYQYLRHIGEHFIECGECGILLRQTVHNKKYCKQCAGYQPIVTKKIQCCDCGQIFEVVSSSRNKKRCDCCQMAHTRRLKTQKQREYRQKCLRVE